jgi:ankyrin repeat protein
VPRSTDFPLTLPPYRKQDRHQSDKGAGGGTPLIYAALYNSEEDIIEALIDNGADVKATDAGGNAVINYAADNKNSKILSVIRKNLLK